MLPSNKSISQIGVGASHTESTINAASRRHKLISRSAIIGILAISAAGMPNALAASAGSAGNALEQVAADQQQQQNPPPPQQHGNDKNQKNGQEHNQQGGQPQYQQGGQQHYQSGGQGSNEQGGYQHTQGGQPQYQQGGQQHNQPGGQAWGQQGQRYDWKSYQPGHQPADWERYHQNFDPKPYQGNWNAQYHYTWRPYVPPHGWYYRRWVYGETLPPAFWVRDYWIDSYWQFGLVNPPYGYVWVRNGPDALLLDVVAGGILSAIYGVFSSAGGYAPSDSYAPPAGYAPPPAGYAPPPAPPLPPVQAQVWYYCDNPPGYYPNVPSCYTPWRQVPAAPTPYSQPQ